MVHQPLTRHWGDPGPGAREERALSVVTGYTVQIYQNCLLDPYSSTLSDSNSNKAMSILMSGAVPGIMIMFLSPVYLSHVTVTQAQPRQGNPLICSRKKCNPGVPSAYELTSSSPIYFVLRSVLRLCTLISVYLIHHFSVFTHICPSCSFLILHGFA